MLDMVGASPETRSKLRVPNTPEAVKHLDLPKPHRYTEPVYLKNL
jgi:hypothetical protein